HHPPSRESVTTSVTACSLVPSGLTVNTAKLWTSAGLSEATGTATVPANAMSEPSGAQRGNAFVTLDVVSCVSLEPSAFILNSWWIWPGPSATKTNAEPSGDQSGANALSGRSLSLLAAGSPILYTKIWFSAPSEASKTMREPSGDQRGGPIAPLLVETVEI